MDHIITYTKKLCNKYIGLRVEDNPSLWWEGNRILWREDDPTLGQEDNPTFWRDDRPTLGPRRSTGFGAGKVAHLGFGFRGNGLTCVQLYEHKRINTFHDLPIKYIQCIIHVWPAVLKHWRVACKVTGIRFGFGLASSYTILVFVGFFWRFFLRCGPLLEVLLGFVGFFFVWSFWRFFFWRYFFRRFLQRFPILWLSRASSMRGFPRTCRSQRAFSSSSLTSTQLPVSPPAGMFHEGTLSIECLQYHLLGSSMKVTLATRTSPSGMLPCAWSHCMQVLGDPYLPH